jgi:hypothetical protein
VSTLEASVTLEDVFTVVEGKRVPLAPELAGYLTLEVADGSQATGGQVDPRTVYISEEGTVALVRPKTAAPTGDAEASVRGILAKLLDASGSATPALTASARRKAGAGLPALVSELEAALIPVNRAAGRRALARLAREVKRVLLGVGRNASVPPPANRPAPPRAPMPVHAAKDTDDVMSGPDAPPGPRGSVASFTDEALTAKRTQQLTEIAAQMNAPEIVSLNMPSAPPEAMKPVIPSQGLTPPPHPETAPGPGPAAPANVSSVKGALSPPPPVVAGTPAAPPVGAGTPAAPAVAPPLPVRAGGPPPVPPRGAAPLPPPPVKGAAGVAPGAPVVGPPPRGKSAPAGPSGGAGAVSPAERAEIDKLFGGDEVDSLLSTFEVSNVGEKQVRNDLKAIAGLDPTPAPPDATTLAELTKDVGKDLPKSRPSEGDSVEALLALSDPSEPVPAAAAPAPAPALPPGAATGKLSAGVPPPQNYPASIVPAPTGGSPLAPPSPLVPMTPVPAPAAAATVTAPKSPPPPMPVVAAAAMEAALKRPITPRQPGRPVPAPASAPAPALSLSASGRREKAEAPPNTSSTRRNKASGGRTGNFRQPRAPRTGLAMLVLTLFVVIAGGIAVWMFKPAFFTGNKRRPVPTASTSAVAVTAAVPRCKVALVVSEVPANAEILLRVGQAPLDVERMPVGTRLEFVATAEGYAPRRAVIKAESTWDKGPDGKPRIDVPIQLDPTKAKPGTVDAWPLAEPGSQVGGSGSPGTVHVVSNVRGAEVWLLAGLGPEARIEQLRCDGDIDVLLAGPPQLRKRLHVGEKEIQAASPDTQGNRVVSVSGK